MRLYRHKSGLSWAATGSILFFFVLLLVWFLSLVSASARYDRQERETLEKNVLKAATTCYAVENFYPADIRYLEDHYGVKIDSKRYAVLYETPGTNILPTVRVVIRNEKGDEDVS